MRRGSHRVPCLLRSRISFLDLVAFLAYSCHYSKDDQVQGSLLRTSILSYADVETFLCTKRRETKLQERIGFSLAWDLRRDCLHVHGFAKAEETRVQSCAEDFLGQASLRLVSRGNETSTILASPRPSSRGFAFPERGNLQPNHRPRCIGQRSRGNPVLPFCSIALPGRRRTESGWTWVRDTFQEERRPRPLRRWRCAGSLRLDPEPLRASRRRPGGSRKKRTLGNGPRKRTVGNPSKETRGFPCPSPRTRPS